MIERPEPSPVSIQIEDHRIDFNDNRPHSAHDNLTPAEFTTNWINRNQPQPA